MMQMITEMDIKKGKSSPSIITKSLELQNEKLNKELSI